MWIFLTADHPVVVVSGVPVVLAAKGVGLDGHHGVAEVLVHDDLVRLGFPINFLLSNTTSR